MFLPTDGLGLKPFIDQLYADMTRIGEIHHAELKGEPIDIEEARAIINRLDSFIDATGQLPMSAKLMVKAMGLGKIQRAAHKHLSELEAKAKTQGVVKHEATPKSETDKIQDSINK